MLTALATALDADVKEILYGPAETDRTAQLRRLAAGAVVSGVVLALVWWGGRLTGGLFDRTYLAAPAWLWKLVPWPLAFLPLGWTMAQGALTLLGVRPPGRPWAV